MSKIAINPQDYNHKLSLAFSMKAGYKIKLAGDGSGEVVNGDGVAYHTVEGICDCPESFTLRQSNIRSVGGFCGTSHPMVGISIKFLG